MPEDNAVPTGINRTPKLQVRINQIDYAVIPPGKLDNSILPKVPVLRIFGSSSTGQTACVHVHQVYPYFFIEYSEDLSPRHVKQYISKLFHSLNHGIALSLKRDPSSRKSQFIRAIVLVKGVHFYGFHSSYSPFLKILVSDPAHMARVVTILQSGSVMGSRFSVYESHLSYVLQFLADFGLYGCGTMDIEEALERGISEEYPSSPAGFGVSPYFRESRVPLELDVIAPHIINRHRVVARNIHHHLQILPTPAPPPPDPLIPSVRELWEDERKHRQSHGLHPSPEIPVDPSESSRSGKGEWVSEARWWDEIRKRIEDGHIQSNVTATLDGWDRFVMTTFESVEAVWEKQYKTWKPPKRQINLAGQADETLQVPRNQEYSWEDGGHEDGAQHQIEVDISMLSNEEVNQLNQEEARDWNAEHVNGLSAIEEDEGSVDENEYDEDRESASDTMEEIGHQSPNDPFVDDDQDRHSQIVEYRLESPPTPLQSSPQIRAGSPTFMNTKSNNLTPTEPQERTEKHIYYDEKSAQESLKTSESFVASVGLKAESGSQKQPKILEDEIQHEIAIFLPEPGDTVTLPTVPSAKERSLLITARAIQLSKIHDTLKKTSTNSYIYSAQPPTSMDLRNTLQAFGLPNKIYQAPYYLKDSDIPEHTKEYAGLTYRLKGGQGIATLDEWSSKQSRDASASTETSSLNSVGVGGWEYASHPPSVKEVRQSMKSIRRSRGHGEKLRSQIEGPTQANIYGFKNSPIGGLSTSRGSADLSVMSVEIFVPTVDNKIPNAEDTEVVAVFYAHHVAGTETIHRGILVVQNPQFNSYRIRKVNFEILESELDLLNRLIDLVVELDPDILTGWELQMSSWGYLEMRGDTYGLPFSELISRAPPRHSGMSIDQWGLRKTSTFKVAGRHVLNLWRIMRSEKKLTIYTFENVVFEVLGRRVPRYSHKTLTEWYHSPVPAHTSILINHLVMKISTNLELLETTEIVTKTAEFARVFGVDFFSVLSRGSQFKVESFMFRIAKPESFVLISPSKSDVGKQNAAECMPLTLEPASAFYSGPLLVLDFQSLYPSIMIAYNYCYSTCLGRITDFQGAYKFGVVSNLDISSELLENLRGHINVSPNGMMYVKPNVRKGLLGRMLIELLDTRVMVKQAMKRVGGDKARKRILDARQLSLKYIANVTYGYTSATFSGRMPAVEIADSIVQSGRETLEKAIDIIDSTQKWGAKVVYGDTDSVFVYLPGKTKEQAFAIGNEIAETITALNPAPIKLKFEKAFFKVYLPCVLMAKKRYVGFKYENIDDREPVFDAKGIETVRRDSVNAQRKMVETCLKLLFRTQDLSEVKDYCCRSWTKLLENKASIHDFIFAKEVRMGAYSDKGPPPPGVMVAARRMISDPNNEPQYGDRIPYVIAQSIQPGARLVDRAMDPLEFMDNRELRLDALYYIKRVLIPPLERIFNLVGADVKQWFDEMPKYTVVELVSPKKLRAGAMLQAETLERTDINAHFSNTQCLSCGEPASQSLCDNCYLSTDETVANLKFRIRFKEERLINAHRICTSCTGSAPPEPIHCESLDCPWFYARRKSEAGMDLVPLFSDIIEEIESRGEGNDSERQEAIEVYGLEEIQDCDSDIYLEDSMEE